MLGENLGAKQAEEYGPINKAVPQEEFASAVDIWVNKIAAIAPLASQEMKNCSGMGGPRTLKATLTTC